MNEGKIIVYGTNWCLDCFRTKRILDKYKINYQWIDINQEKDAREFVRDVNHGNLSVPTIVFPDGSTLTEPSGKELINKLNLE